MRITQAYVSPSVADFPFLRCLNLEPYHDVEAPAVFYGCYTMFDLMKIMNHQHIAVIRWCGQDAFDFRHWDLIPGAYHVTPLANVHRYLCKKFKNVSLIKPENLEMIATHTPKGTKIYAYAPASFPEYHGSDIIKQLAVDHEIIVGDGTYSRAHWYGGIGDQYYDESFIGLMLSPFAGGAGSVVDMGLRGRKCVTNVMDMPNAIPWQTVDDIRKAIEQESKTIGDTDNEMAHRVFDAIDKEYLWLNTEYYE